MAIDTAGMLGKTWGGGASLELWSDPEGERFDLRHHRTATPALWSCQAAHSHPSPMVAHASDVGEQHRAMVDRAVAL